MIIVKLKQECNIIRGDFILQKAINIKTMPKTQPATFLSQLFGDRSG